MTLLDPVLNLTDPIYSIDTATSTVSKSTSPSPCNMTIRPPTPSTPTVANHYNGYSQAYSLFEPKRDGGCSQCLDHTSSLTTLCNQHYLCSSCLSQSLHQKCPLCPPKTATLDTTTAITSATFPCVKLSNIPWDVSQSDIRHFFGSLRTPSTSIYAQSIHILMDRTTGKTLSEAYVELATMDDMLCAIETKNQRSLKGRVVSVTQCHQDELLSVIFPKWRGQFKGNMAIPPDTKVVRSMATAAGGGGTTCPPFITREEINSLLVVCKNYKLHFSRKCAERPFENIITIISKYPWHHAHLITGLHRDHVYEMLKLAIESLMNHLAKDYVQIEPSLLERLVRAGLLCPAFTERQKMVLLQVTRLQCPLDLVYVFSKHDHTPSPPSYDHASDPVFYHSPLSSRHSAYERSPPYIHHQQVNQFNTRPLYTNYYVSPSLSSSTTTTASNDSNTSTGSVDSQHSVMMVSPLAPTTAITPPPPPAPCVPHYPMLHFGLTQRQCRKPMLSPWAQSYLPIDENTPSAWSTVNTRSTT